MNLDLILPVVSQVLGRDVKPDVELFLRSRAAIGSALSPEGQDFFIKNWRAMGTFMETPDGQKAIAVFMDSWAASLVPKQLSKQPDPQ